MNKSINLLQVVQTGTKTCESILKSTAITHKMTNFSTPEYPILIENCKKCKNGTPPPKFSIRYFCDFRNPKIEKRYHHPSRGWYPWTLTPLTLIALPLTTMGTQHIKSG